MARRDEAGEVVGARFAQAYEAAVRCMGAGKNCAGCPLADSMDCDRIIMLRYKQLYERVRALVAECPGGWKGCF